MKLPKTWQFNQITHVLQTPFTHISIRTVGTQIQRPSSEYTCPGHYTATTIIITTTTIIIILLLLFERGERAIGGFKRIMKSKHLLNNLIQYVFRVSIMA